MVYTKGLEHSSERTHSLVCFIQFAIPLNFNLGYIVIIDINEVPTLRAPSQTQQTTFEQLLLLDSYTRPGISHRRFNKLFARCPCGLTMTRRKFRRHECWRAPKVLNDVIDLTQANDGGTMVIDLTGDTDVSGDEGMTADTDLTLASE
jgi:hypothetical protein